MAKTIRVGNQQAVKTIQQAISMAVNGDTVLVDGGVYHEKNIIVSKSVFLVGINHPLGPINAIHSPLLQVTETLSSACSFPNFFDTLLAIIIMVKISLKDVRLLNFRVLMMAISFLSYPAKKSLNCGTRSLPVDFVQ